MSRSTQGMILLLLSVMSVLFLVSYAVIPTSATTIVQLQPNSVSSGDRVYITANLAENSSTVALSYYADVNKNGKDDDGGSWIKEGIHRSIFRFFDSNERKSPI